MPAIGKTNPIVEILHRKTKVKIEDISDIFRVLSDSMAEAIIEANLEPGKPFNLGGVTFSFSKKNGSLSVKPSRPFKTRMAELKKEKSQSDK